MDAWAQRGSPARAVAEDAVRLDVAMVDNGSRTCSVRQLPPGPSVTEEERTVRDDTWHVIITFNSIEWGRE